MVTRLKFFGIKILAIVCLIFGSITILTPIPTGVFLLALGTALILMTSKNAIRFVRRLRRRYPKIDRILDKAETQLPSKLAKTLRRTSVRISNTAKNAGNGLRSMRKNSHTVDASS